MKSNNLIILIILISIKFTLVYADEDIYENDCSNEDDVVYFTIEELDIFSCEKINEGIYDNDVVYTVYKFNEKIKITISVDENELYYIIGNVESNEAMDDILDYLTGIFTEPIPYINGDGFTAFFHDTENLYFKDNYADYIGTFTVYGNHLFVEEAFKQEKIIVQRQWCTPEFYIANTVENGDGWGFIASWDKVEYEVITETKSEEKKQVLPAQYRVRSWQKTRDSFYTIAAMPFIYGDSRLWILLYNANKNKLPDPDEPDIILPGTILNIPSIRGEERSGLWTFDNIK